MASPQFSTAEILEAARRAEAEGKLDFAIQFYRHIVDHHGGADEVREARDGYLRLTRHGRGEAATPAHRYPGVGTGPVPAPPPVMPRPPQAPPPDRAHGPGTSGHDRNLPLVVTRPQAPLPVELPVEPEFAFRDRYRAGTFMAQAVSFVGWLAVGIAAALGAAGLAGATPGLAAASLLGLPAGVVWGLSVSAGGLALVFVSQLALAVFDNANASRHLLAIERAKAEL